MISCLLIFLVFFRRIECGGLNWASLSPFLSSAPNYQFLYNQYYDVTDTVNFELDSIGDWVVATGDFFNERRNDILVLGCRQRCLYLMEWDHPKWDFKRGETQYIVQTTSRISHVIPGDYNYDGYLDLLIQFSSSPQTAQTNVSLYLNQQKNKPFSKFEPFDFRPLPVDHLLPIDYNSNYNLDLLGISSETGEKGVWVNKAKDSSEVLFEFEKLSGDVLTNIPEQPFTPSFVDLNGDCASDLFISTCLNSSTCDTPLYQVFLNSGGVLTFSHSYVGEQGAERVLFDDIDRDGNFDMIFYLCYPKDTCEIVSKIVIYYNAQERMCGTQFANKKKCKSSSNLCKVTKFDQSQWFGQPKYRMEYPLDAGRRLVRNTHGVRQPLIADFNLDGFPDIFVITESLSGEDKKIELFKNVACSSKTGCTSGQERDGLRSFVKESAIGDLSQLKHPNHMFLVDLDGMGHVDVMVTSFGGKGANRNYSTSVFYNNNYNDAFFLKTYNLNGSPSHGKIYPLKYGAYLPGSMIKFTIDDEYGKKQPHIGTLKASSTHGNIETPYILLGTGRTTDYIQNLFWAVPVSAKNEQYKDDYAQLVPNSQVVCIPRVWKIELFQIPSKHAFWVGISVVSTLILLGIPICCCYCWDEIKERKEKRKKKELEGVFIST